MKKIKYRFIVTIFGNKHLGMLLTNVYSITKSNPYAKISVFWQDVNKEYINILQKRFKNINFIKTYFDISLDLHKRISSKTLLWSLAANKYKNENLCLVDVDTLVIKDIGKFFEESFDILFTIKKEHFPLNTGVILCKGIKNYIFFELWLDETLKIIENRKLLTISTSSKYHYGGADQMAFYKIINFKKNTKIFYKTYKKKKLKLKAIGCEVLNETRSKSITLDTHIIHYKGGWQSILLRGSNFSKNRTKHLSWEMYIFYLRTYLEAINYIDTEVKSNNQFEIFNIKIPFYLNKNNFKENKFLYLIYYTYNMFRSRLRKR